MTPIIFEEGNVKNFEKTVTTEMDKALVHYEKELLGIRTGKAQVSMIEDIKVDCYGNTTLKLKEIASLAAPDVNMLTIQPWDKNVIGDIDRAIIASNLGFSPIIDSDIIRLEIPRMTTTRREELSKLVGHKIEDGKINIRNIRKEAHNMTRDAQKAKKISEDFAQRLNKTLDDITLKYTSKIDALGEKKKQELKAL